MPTSSQTLEYLQTASFKKPEDTALKSLPLMGDGPAIRRLRLQIERIGPHFRTVLVRGEMGTGKELVARALHEHSNHAYEPFVTCHASWLNSLEERHNIISRYMRVTGAGTFFLDGVEEMSIEAQRQLLVILEQKVSTRLIASTAVDLRRMAAAGRFRHELYSRLAMVEIVVEPLRRRVEDIPALAMHFVEQFAAQYEKQVDIVARATVERLQRHTWPGNIREFENVLRNGVLHCEGTLLEPADLSSMVEFAEANDESHVRPCGATARLQDVIDQHVLQVLRECSGNKVRAAEMLGISRSTLYRMLEGGCSPA